MPLKDNPCNTTRLNTIRWHSNYEHYRFSLDTFEAVLTAIYHKPADAVYVYMSKPNSASYNLQSVNGKFKFKTAVICRTSLELFVRKRAAFYPGNSEWNLAYRQRHK